MRKRRMRRRKRGRRGVEFDEMASPCNKFRLSICQTCLNSNFLLFVYQTLPQVSLFPFPLPYPFHSNFSYNADQLADKLDGECLLLPTPQANVSDEYHRWLVVPCGFLEDVVGEWGITPETFFASQQSFCNVPLGKYQDNNNNQRLKKHAD
jgi:hypothetical protein